MSPITDFSMPPAEEQEHGWQPSRGHPHRQSRVAAFAAVPELVRGLGANIAELTEDPLTLRVELLGA